MRRAWKHLRWLGALALCALASSGHAVEPVTLAIADFDYLDTSGETKDQVAAHAERLKNFTRLLSDELSATGKYQVVALTCPEPPCSAGAMDAQSLTDAARQSGARLLLYGGIHKMSTLVQFGKAQIADLESDQVVYDRTITFRGDDDNAWKRAGEFLVEDLAAKDLAQ
ncbi:MAG: hypothetical protein C0484_18800 [Rhodospirillum sp.]|jgi:hypothetical protein|nr:hypothetical protein [Rhodospirillum sp.]